MLYIKKNTSTRLKSLKVYSAYPSDKLIFTNHFYLYASSFDKFIALSASFVVGQSDYFGFGFAILSWKQVYQ